MLWISANRSIIANAIWLVMLRFNVNKSHNVFKSKLILDTFSIILYIWILQNQTNLPACIWCKVISSWHRISPWNENLNLLVRIKFLNLLLRTKFYWSWDGGLVLILRTAESFILKNNYRFYFTIVEYYKIQIITNEKKF